MSNNTETPPDYNAVAIRNLVVQLANLLNNEEFFWFFLSKSEQDKLPNPEIPMEIDLDCVPETHADHALVFLNGHGGSGGVLTLVRELETLVKNRPWDNGKKGDTLPAIARLRQTVESYSDAIGQARLRDNWTQVYLYAKDALSIVRASKESIFRPLQKQMAAQLGETAVIPEIEGKLVDGRKSRRIFTVEERSKLESNAKRIINKKKHITRKDLSTRLGISEGAVSGLEAWKNRPGHKKRRPREEVQFATKSDKTNYEVLVKNRGEYDPKLASLLGDEADDSSEELDRLRAEQNADAISTKTPINGEAW